VFWFETQGDSRLPGQLSPAVAVYPPQVLLRICAQDSLHDRITEGIAQQTRDNAIVKFKTAAQHIPWWDIIEIKEPAERGYARHFVGVGDS
jgi:hypothetical protein